MNHWHLSKNPICSGTSKKLDQKKLDFFGQLISANWAKKKKKKKLRVKKLNYVSRK